MANSMLVHFTKLAGIELEKIGQMYKSAHYIHHMMDEVYNGLHGGYENSSISCEECADVSSRTEPLSCRNTDILGEVGNSYIIIKRVKNLITLRLDGYRKKSKTLIINIEQKEQLSFLSWSSDLNAIAADHHGILLKLFEEFSKKIIDYKIIDGIEPVINLPPL